MKTIISWFIANIKSIVYTLLVIIFEIMLFSGNIPVPENSSTADMALYGPLTLILTFSLAGGIPAKTLIEDCFNLIMTVCILVSAVIFHNQFAFLSIFVYGLIPALTFALAVGIFTATNMELVVSRRVLYRNSTSDLFGITIQYTLNRFLAALNAITCIYIFVVVPDIIMIITDCLK